MTFFKSDLPTPPMEDLLTRWEKAQSIQGTPSSPSQVPDPPTLENFLTDEDILRECRSDNRRLVNYIRHPIILPQLVHKAFHLPPLLPTSHPTQSLEPSTEQQRTDSPIPDLQRQRQLNQAYVASELLSADNRLIADAILSHSIVLNLIFQSIEEAQQGSLETIFAVHFSKVIISLLKMRNAPTIEAMSARGPSFINGLLNHINSAPIAELIVLMLNGPETEPTYGTQPPKKPPAEALYMLANSDILGGLADCFVWASNHSLDALTPLDTPIDQSSSDTAEFGATIRRLREETMANVTSTMLGLTDRLLQLPPLGCPIPSRLCPYMIPVVVSRILDAGLLATGSDSAEKDILLDTIPHDVTNEDKVEAFTLRSNSALLHSLGLAADLMTTPANVVRDEEDDTMNMTNMGVQSNSGRPTCKPMYSGKGIGPSVGANAANNTKKDDESVKEEHPSPIKEVSQEEMRVLTEYAKKKAGDRIVETILLEAELATSFPRLSKMFGDHDEIDQGKNRLRPLGSMRLKLAEFFVACMQKGSQETVQQIIDLGVPKKLLELFSMYQWSSMLHGVVTNSIVSALEGDEVGRPARSAWFGAGLIPWLISSWMRNTREEGGGKARARAGYMGHLIRMGTALKAYMVENESNPKADLPDFTELRSFDHFSEQILAPAHSREATPLCSEQTAAQTEADEGEEATDVLEMGGISFVENLSQASNPAPLQFFNAPTHPRDVVIDEEEEIKTVEVDDLDHFGADDDDGDKDKNRVDHDIPAELREQLSRADAVADTAIKQIEEVTIEEIAPPKPSFKQEPVRAVSREEQDEISVDEYKGVIDNVDSSSEDEGSYIAFVDDRKDIDTEKATSGIADLHLGEHDTNENLDGIVTEIEEPAPLTPSANNLQSLAANITAVSDDNGSSDEEYEAWEDPARVVDPPQSEQGEQASIKDRQKSETRSTSLG